MVVVEGFLWSPLAFLLVGATLRNANPELEEAARVSGAGTWMTIRRVTLRLSLPSILALAMLVFIRAIEAFDVPALVGLPGRISVLTTDIYGNMVAQAPPDIGGASALSVLMLALVLVLLAIYGRLSRHAERFATITGKGFRPRPFDLGHDRRLHRPDVGHEWRTGVERLDHHRRDLPDRHRDHGELRPRHRVGERRRDAADRTYPDGGLGALDVAIKADHVVPGLAEREADRATDEAGADERDAKAGRRPPPPPSAPNGVVGETLAEHVAPVPEAGRRRSW